MLDKIEVYIKNKDRNQPFVMVKFLNSNLNLMRNLIFLKPCYMISKYLMENV